MSKIIGETSDSKVIVEYIDGFQDILNMTREQYKQWTFNDELLQPPYDEIYSQYGFNIYALMKCIQLQNYEQEYNIFYSKNKCELRVVKNITDMTVEYTSEEGLPIKTTYKNVKKVTVKSTPSPKYYEVTVECDEYIKQLELPKQKVKQVNIQRVQTLW